MEIQPCPKCKASTVVINGYVMPSGEAGRGTSTCFVPCNARTFRRKVGVNLQYGFSACSSCGHLWTSLAPDELRVFIQTFGTKLARQHLQTLEAGPSHDLPDTPEAREAGTRVAEIDALVLQGKQPEATRRYRELMPTTWDKAIDAVRDWQDLERPQKLARFGWQPKEGSEPTDHPMSDRLLDGYGADVPR